MADLFEVPPERIAEFLDRYQSLHDAEILSVHVEEHRLIIDLRNLCDIDPETNWWRETQTSASLIFDGIRDLRMEGDFVGYCVSQLGTTDGGEVFLNGDAGQISARYNSFRLYSSEPLGPQLKV
ncbi:hypothetical protein [Vannielia sp. SX4]|uniref:hypothetical protein n=1 Tax=Vannielia sp. SX4 TaxID=3463852 RepID=UPI004058B080